MTEIEEFVERFVCHWLEECNKRGIKHIDGPDTNTRMLARVIAKTILKQERKGV